MERIWFPDGPPGRRALDGDADDTARGGGGGGGDGGDDMPLVRQAYEHLARTGTFADGVMPEVAPRWEWIRWDL